MGIEYYFLLAIKALFGLLGFVLLLAIYFLPSIVAKYRKHIQLLPIFLLNFFLGFILVGWVGALVWAVTGNHRNKKYCPFCAERIKQEALVCMHCGKDVPA